MSATRRGLAAGLLLATLTVDCRADLAPPRHCELRAARDFKAGDPELEVLKAHVGQLLRVCAAPGLPPARLIVSAPIRSSARVCRFTQQALPDASDGGQAPLLQTFARVDAGACPAPETADYVRTEGVPDAELVRLTQFQREIGASAAAFDRDFLGFAGAQAPVKPPGFDDFRRAVIEGAVRVKAIYRLDGADGAVVMAFSDPRDPSTTWRVRLELIAGKPVVLGFETRIA